MIYILLPVHNRIAETKKFIECLKEQKNRGFRLVLVDDGCYDGTAEYVADQIKEVKILRGDGNLWWAGSLEVARKYLESMDLNRDRDIVLIANDDITFDSNFLDHVVQDNAENRDALILAQCHERKTGKVLGRGGIVDWKNFKFSQASNTEEINVLSTRGLYMTYGVFRSIGKFHIVLLPHYASDYEFTHRAHKQGIRLMVSRRAKIFGNLRTTGVHDINYDQTFSELLRNLFISKKSVYNRLMWTSFVILSCPPKYIPKNLFRIHSGTILILGKWVIHRLRNAALLVQVWMKRAFNEEIKIVLGSGGMNQKHWISTDQSELDITERINWLKHFNPGEIDAIFAEHVWEHLSGEDASSAIKNCYDFLKPGGYIRVAVPDGYFPDQEYIDQVKPGGTGPGSDDHKFLYNYKTMSDLFSSNGFKVDLLEYWDEDGVFHENTWDSEDGLVIRSRSHDPRNKDGVVRYTSLIIDAIKLYSL